MGRPPVRVFRSSKKESGGEWWWLARTPAEEKGKESRGGEEGNAGAKMGARRRSH